VFLVHHDPLTGAVEGVWCLDEDGRPEAHYKEPAGAAAFWGSLILDSAVETVCWYRFWEQLSRRAPYTIWWENVVSDLEPGQLLAKLPPLTIHVDAWTRR
jgi:hypothetical protein